MPKQLHAISYLAPTQFDYFQAICAALSRATGIQITLAQSVFDSLDDPAFQNDEVDIAFVCGLPYTRRSQTHPKQFTILGTSISSLKRYQQQPVYFADVIVKANSGLNTFGDLHNKVFCYNDPGSNSGYNLLRGWMLDSGLTNGFFGQTIASGSHQRSMEWVIAGKADCAAIDSLVLEHAYQQHPELVDLLRVCISIGPSPAPPVLAASRLGNDTITRMQNALLHPDDQLAAALAAANVQRFAALKPADYAVLGQIWDKAIGAGFATIC